MRGVGELESPLKEAAVTDGGGIAGDSFGYWIMIALSVREAPRTEIDPMVDYSRNIAELRREAPCFD